jgi:hypothetical protein
MNQVDQPNVGQALKHPINEGGGHWQFDHCFPIRSTIHQNQMGQNQKVCGNL